MMEKWILKNKGKNDTVAGGKNVEVETREKMRRVQNGSGIITEGEGNTEVKTEEGTQAKRGRVQAIARIFGETEDERKKREVEGRLREKRQREKLERGKEVMKKRGIYEGPNGTQDFPPERVPKNEIIKSKCKTLKTREERKEREELREGGGEGT